MRRLLKRWYVWLGLVLLVGLAGSAALICSGRTQINRWKKPTAWETLQLYAKKGAAKIGVKWD